MRPRLQPLKVPYFELSVGCILYDIIDQITPSLPVRREAVRAKGDYAPFEGYPITSTELRAFLSEFVRNDPYFGKQVLTRPDSCTVNVPITHYEHFLQTVSSEYAGSSHWLGACGPYYIPVKKHISTVERKQSSEIPVPKTPDALDRTTKLYAPSLNVLFYLFRQRIDLNALSWRQLEEVIAELLKHEGYEVELGRGTKDEGADIIAYQTLPTVGFLKTVWQAKHLMNGNKVGLSIVRELADVRNELDATKGFIVTSSFLTRGALKRIQRDSYQLGKVEKPELEEWINRTLCGQQPAEHKLM